MKKNSLEESGIRCTKCLKESFWKTKDGRLKCKNCHYIFTLKKDHFNISRKDLKKIISEFILGSSTNTILKKNNVSKYQLLKILTLLRFLMIKNIPDEFQETIKLTPENFVIDKNIKNPIIGIFSRREKIYAKVLTEIKPKDLKSFIQKEKKVFEKSNMALVYKKNIYRINKSNKKDAIDLFWSYLKNKLALKGGIRKEKFPLFLGEYVWRYNNRKLSVKEQEKKLIKLLSFAKRKNYRF